jgi:hypothetical protein
VLLIPSSWGSQLGAYNAGAYNALSIFQVKEKEQAPPLHFFKFNGHVRKLSYNMVTDECLQVKQVLGYFCHSVWA